MKSINRCRTVLSAGATQIQNPALGVPKLPFTYMSYLNRQLFYP